MLRLLLTSSLCLTTAIALPSAAVEAGQTRYSLFDEKGQAVASTWTATDRFSTLTLASGDSLRVQQGERWQIRASGSPAVLADLRFLVEDGKIVIGRRNLRGKHRSGTARITVTAPSLTGITLAGSGDVSVDQLTGAAASVTLAGSGTLGIANLQVDRLTSQIAGSGELIVSGHAQDTRLAIAGSGDLSGEHLTVGDAKITVAGSGDARLRATGAVESTIVGSGNVYVTGTKDCSLTRRGSGRLICSN